MNKSFVMLLLGTLMLSITGCAPTKKTNSYSNKQEYKHVSDNGVTVSNDIAEEINGKILSNLTGYEKNAPKKLLSKDKNAAKICHIIRRYRICISKAKSRGSK